MVFTTWLMALKFWLLLIYSWSATPCVMLNDDVWLFLTTIALCMLMGECWVSLKWMLNVGDDFCCEPVQYKGIWGIQFWHLCAFLFSWFPWIMVGSSVVHLLDITYYYYYCCYCGNTSAFVSLSINSFSVFLTFSIFGFLSINLNSSLTCECFRLAFSPP